MKVHVSCTEFHHMVQTFLPKSLGYNGSLLKNASSFKTKVKSSWSDNFSLLSCTVLCNRQGFSDNLSLDTSLTYVNNAPSVNKLSH